MKIKIVYATRMGTTKYVAQSLQKYLSSKGHTVDLHSLNTDGQSPMITGYDLVLFGSPTYEMGDPETAMLEYIHKANEDLSQVKCAIFGLGEKSFPDFCASVDHVEEWVHAHGGSLLIPSLRIDGYPHNLKPVEDWAAQIQ